MAYSIDPWRKRLGIRHKLHCIYIGAALLLLAVLTGCAAGVPAPIREVPATPVLLGEVQQNPDRFVGMTVRWGGVIVQTRNRKDDTVIELVSRSLGSDGRPLLEDRSAGRFLAQLSGFHDPAIYAAGRELTVRGVITGVSEQAIGDYTYRYPQLRADGVYLWPQRHPPEPIYYDPWWWDPWYPWGWPYYYAPPPRW
jgi:outer membrane lipoprotein